MHKTHDQELAATIDNMTDTIPLIPREALLGNPSRSSGKISRDGKWLSWLAPYKGTLNIWLAPVENRKAARLMTNARDQPITQYLWSPDSASLLYIQDKAGDENYLLYRVDIESGEEMTLTPFENTRVQLIGGSKRIRNKALIGLNNRDPKFHDVHLLDLNSGELNLVYENNAYAEFIADDTLTLRIAMAQNSTGGTDYFHFIDDQVEKTPFTSTAMEDSLTTWPDGYTTDGSTLYWLDSRGRNTAALYAENVATGERTLIAEDDRADISDMISNPLTGVVEGYSVNYLTEEWILLTDDLRDAFAWLRQRLTGEFGIISRNDANNIWIIWNDQLTAPESTYIFDRSARTLDLFYVTRPELSGAPLQAMHTREIIARDGLTLPSYLTLPPSSDDNGDGVPDAPLPMVLLVHGGPWARDDYGFNSIQQLLANRGYAVLSVNFRGSTGFGKSFINAGNKQWGLSMHDDLIDAVQWAIDEGIAQPEKVAIIGASYGGYATLAGLAFTPETFACGVDIVGPSNLETLLETIPSYWEPRVKTFHERMGNPTTPEGLALLRAASPLYKAEQITKPLLIAQGANDPRVKQAESDQIVGAMKDAGIPVTYVLFPDEGHGFDKPTNSLAFSAIAENFLAKCLGGRAEPLGNVLSASTANVIEGAEYVAGLKTALGGGHSSHK